MWVHADHTLSKYVPLESWMLQLLLLLIMIMNTYWAPHFKTNPKHFTVEAYRQQTVTFTRDKKSVWIFYEFLNSDLHPVFSAGSPLSRDRSQFIIPVTGQQVPGRLHAGHRLHQHLGLQCSRPPTSQWRGSGPGSWGCENATHVCPKDRDGHSQTGSQIGETSKEERKMQRERENVCVPVPVPACVCVCVCVCVCACVF